MPQSASAAAIQSLTEWWEEMGCDIDVAQIRALSAATRQAVAAPTGQSAALDAPQQQSQPAQQAQQTPPPQTRASGRRNKSKSVKDWVAEAQSLAGTADTLDALKAVIEQFEGCPLKQMCENTVVFDGAQGGPIMIIGEGPGPQEDRKGLPFIGPAGQLLDKMLASIGLDRTRNTFITNVNYWRPPGNRNPETDELAVCRPFVERMIDIAAPKLILAAGGVPAKSLLETKTGIMRLRGTQHTFTTQAGTSTPLIPMLHPAYLLRRPQDKSRAWRDLLAAQALIRELGVEI